MHQISPAARLYLKNFPGRNCWTPAYTWTGKEMGGEGIKGFLLLKEWEGKGKDKKGPRGMGWKKQGAGRGSVRID